MNYLSRGEGETERIGEYFSAQLEKGSAVCLYGELGAGKTAFVRGLARGLGFAGRVASPTYAIVNEHFGGRLPLFHFDLYRLDGRDELDNIGFDDYFYRDGVIVCEWAEKLHGDLPDGAFRVIIEKMDDHEDMRRITITGGQAD